MSELEEQNVRDRIKIVMKEKYYSAGKLAGGDASLQRKLNNQINGSTTISADTILLILHTFPDVSAEWLTRGDGEMYLSARPVGDMNLYVDSQHATGHGTNISGNDSAAVVKLQLENDYLQRRVGDLEKDLDTMRNDRDAQQRRADQLYEKVLQLQYTK